MRFAGFINVILQLSQLPTKQTTVNQQVPPPPPPDEDSSSIVNCAADNLVGLIIIIIIIVFRNCSASLFVTLFIRGAIARRVFHFFHFIALPSGVFIFSFSRKRRENDGDDALTFVNLNASPIVVD